MAAWQSALKGVMVASCSGHQSEQLLLADCSRSDFL
jgi:hypothetical protein